MTELEKKFRKQFKNIIIEKIGYSNTGGQDFSGAVDEIIKLLKLTGIKI